MGETLECTWDKTKQQKVLNKRTLASVKKRNWQFCAKMSILSL